MLSDGRIVSGRFELARDKVARIVRDVKDIDIDDLYDQLEKLRDNVHQLSHRVGKSASAVSLIYQTDKLTHSSSSSEACDSLSNHLHGDIASAAHADGSSSTAAQVYRASFHERTAVIDPNDDGAAIARNL